MENMQESVVSYGRMCRRIEAAMAEITELEQIKNQYGIYQKKKESLGNIQYRLDKLNILQKKQQITETMERIALWRQDVLSARAAQQELEEKMEACKKEHEEVCEQISGSGYSRLEEQLKNVQEHLKLLERSVSRLQSVSARLTDWEEVDVVSNQVLWDIEKFQSGDIAGAELERLKKSLQEVEEETKKEVQAAAGEIRALNKEKEILENDLAELRMGKKAYPRELESARSEISRKLYDRYKKNIPVRVLADLLDIRDETWRNAIEGYLGANKLCLLVEPGYVQAAMEIYEQLDKKKYWRVSLVDTEKVMEGNWVRKEHSLAEEIETKEDYVKAYIDFLLGNVMKCDSIQKLRQCRIGVTADCMLYKSFQLRRMNPENYTRNAFIGEKSRKQRQKELLAHLEELSASLQEYEKQEQEGRKILSLEFLKDTVEEYQNLLTSAREKKEKEKQKKRIQKQLEEISSETLEQLKQRRETLLQEQKKLEDELDESKYKSRRKEEQIEKETQENIARNEEVLVMEQNLRGSKQDASVFEAYLEKHKNPRFDRLMEETASEVARAQQESQEERNKLVDVRSEYLRNHPKRDFSASVEENDAYEKLLEELACEELEEYRQKAGEQAKAAVEHFKEDFVYKIRSAIKEALSLIHI